MGTDRKCTVQCLACNRHSVNCNSLAPAFLVQTITIRPVAASASLSVKCPLPVCLKDQVKTLGGSSLKSKCTCQGWGASWPVWRSLSRWICPDPITHVTSSLSAGWAAQQLDQPLAKWVESALRTLRNLPLPTEVEVGSGRMVLASIPRGCLLIM